MTQRFTRATILLFLVLCLMVSIPISSALSSVSDEYVDTSKISGIYQTTVSGGTVHLSQYNVSLDLSGFYNCRKILIDHNDVGEVLTDFPILVHLNSSNIDWGKVQDDLDDLRFTQDNSTLLDAELDSFVTNDEAWIWVKIPSVSNLTDTELFMFYNNPSASSYWNPEAVWDANTVFRSHMNDDPDTSHIQDSTSNDNDGTKKDANEPIVTTSGKIGNAQDFDGTDDYIKTTQTSSLDPLKITISLWLKAGTLSGWSWIFGRQGSSDCRTQLSDGGTIINVEDFPISVVGMGHLYDITCSFSTGQFYKVTITFDGEYIRGYVNGVLKKTSDQYIGNFNPTDLQGWIFGCGDYAPSTNPFDGIKDEITISSVAISQSWDFASYESERDHLLTFGNEGYSEVYYTYGTAYSTNLLSSKNASAIQNFLYDVTIINPATVHIQFSQNNVTWMNQYGIVDAWTSLNNGTQTIDLYGLGWKGNLFYRINMTQTSPLVSPSLSKVSVYYSMATTGSVNTSLIIIVLVVGVPLLIIFLLVVKRR